MRAAVLSEGRFSVETIPDPTPEPGTVVLRVSACGICGTDHGIYKNHLLPDGSVIGHEFAGTVEDIASDVRDWEPGDRAAALPIPYCGHCELCRGGQQNLCRHGLATTMGCGGRAGALAEMVVVPAASLRRLHASLDPRLGALAEPLAVALHAVNLGAIAPGTRVGIIGLGPLGLFAGLIARRSGGLVFGMDDRPSRIDCAHSLGLGAFVSDDLADERIRDLTRGGPEVLIEASGRPESIERAGQLARVGGRVVLVSSYHAPAEIRPGHWMNRGISLLPSIAYTEGEFEAALDLLTTGQIDVSQLVTSVHGLASVQSVFERFETQRDVVKVLIDPSQ
jgi:(R,R)-butanediol dehydrogenase / meso-butanediol dehydrogenase / diacetyl reductase